MDPAALAWALEEIPDFLRGQDWVLIGRVYSTGSRPGSQTSIWVTVSARIRLGALAAPLTVTTRPAGQPPVKALARSWLSSSGAGSGLRASLLGHHIHRPRSRLSAVTSTDRTMIVSSRMPNATAKPSSVKNVAGMVARTANVPASTKPAEVDHPAGRGQPGERAPPGIAL